MGNQGCDPRTLGQHSHGIDLLETGSAEAVEMRLLDAVLDQMPVGVVIAEAPGGRVIHALVIVSDDPRLRRLLQITGLLSVLSFETSLAAAVESGVGNPAA